MKMNDELRVVVNDGEMVVVGDEQLQTVPEKMEWTTFHRRRSVNHRN
ncbi:hypothetical protein Hanom_Chr17g01557851 [Helianthus anomalus]